MDKVLCIGKTKSGDNFEWTEKRIWLYVVYTQGCEKNGWCNCIECFKYRFLDALKKVNRDEFKTTEDYERAASKIMTY